MKAGTIEAKKYLELLKNRNANVITKNLTVVWSYEEKYENAQKRSRIIEDF
jgi:hypothetical protein